MDIEILNLFKYSYLDRGPCRPPFSIDDLQYLLELFNNNEKDNISFEAMLAGLTEYLVESPPGQWNYQRDHQPIDRPRRYQMPTLTERRSTKTGSNGVSIKFDDE